MRVHLTTEVSRQHIDIRLFHEANDLDVIGCLCELHPGDRAVGDDAAAMPWLGAPRDLLALRVRDGAVGFYRRPETEIYARRF